MDLCQKERSEIIIHLASHSGVRYPTENQLGYLKSNVDGTFEFLKGVNIFPLQDMLLASSSSAYVSVRI
jgi:UDP-glucuronate 4-epimerase